MAENIAFYLTFISVHIDLVHRFFPIYMNGPVMQIVKNLNFLNKDSDLKLKLAVI